MDKTISVVVPVYISNTAQIPMTYKCLELARKTSLPFELVIVETESQYFKDADVYIYEKKRSNPNKSINRAFKVCSGDYITLLTNDVFVEEGWLERLIECFSLPDCGLATLASTQFNHIKQDVITEGIWFSVAMMKKEDAWFDERYQSTWADTDLITRLYLTGKKMYRNFNCVVEHKPGQTEYQKPDHQSNFELNKAKYREKYKEHSESRIYKVFTEGWIV